MGTSNNRQQDRAVSLLYERGMARMSEFIEAGITAATISRMQRKGDIARLARGLYSLPNLSRNESHSFAQAAKLIPNGIICLESALAFHGLTEHVPSRIWVAI